MFIHSKNLYIFFEYRTLENTLFAINFLKLTNLDVTFMGRPVASVAKIQIKLI